MMRNPHQGIQGPIMLFVSRVCMGGFLIFREEILENMCTRWWDAIPSCTRRWDATPLSTRLLFIEHVCCMCSSRRLLQARHQWRRAQACLGRPRAAH
jgi:hypothetical protein